MRYAEISIYLESRIRLPEIGFQQQEAEVLTSEGGA